MHKHACIYYCLVKFCIHYTGTALQSLQMSCKSHMSSFSIVWSDKRIREFRFFIDHNLHSNSSMAGQVYILTHGVLIVQLQGGKTNKGRLSRDEGKNCKDNSHRTDGQHPDMWCKDHLPETEAKFANIGNKMVSEHSSQNEMHMKESNHKHMAIKSSNIGVLEEQLTKKVVVSESGVEVRAEKDENKLCSDDTVVVRFVDTAIVGKSNAEDARHHGLVEPTINTKEAMNAINSMFREPLEPSISGRTNKNQPSIGSSMENGFRIFSDESFESQQTSSEVPSLPQLKRPDNNLPLDESFEIYVDGEETVDVKEKVNGKGIQAQDTNYNTTSSKHASVSARPNDLPSECVKDPNPRRPVQDGFREDTVVYRFVGSTISKAEEPEVENVWHHGLVEPTINFKEAMKDINSMFGKPIEFTRKSRPKKHNKAPDVKGQSEAFLILPDDDSDDADDAVSVFQKPLNTALKGGPENRNKVPDVMNNHSGFLILPDDELDNQQESSIPSPSKRNGSDLFEQTVCTKEAMDEINKLFSMPMDF